MQNHAIIKPFIAEILSLWKDVKNTIFTAISLVSVFFFYSVGIMVCISQLHCMLPWYKSSDGELDSRIRSSHSVVIELNYW